MNYGNQLNHLVQISMLKSVVDSFRYYRTIDYYALYLSERLSSTNNYNVVGNI